MKVQIYSRDGCPFCEMAKDWFAKNGINFDEVIYNNIQERYKFYEELNQSGRVENPVATVPQIFVDDEHIGGFTELQSKAKYILSKK
ncbi:glutaredoxin domain-containing protein [Francisellaceae bacterium CB299]|jgi:glutaredoxin 1